MTPVPLDLPVRLSDAAALGNLIFEVAERRPLTSELRTRLAGQAVMLRLASTVPYFGSLERDPVHPSSYYLAVDGSEGQPLLLHIATAHAPTSSLFAKPLLVGRMPRADGPEMVTNCLPFGPADRDAVETFARGAGPQLLPRPAGARPVLALESSHPEVDFPAALEAFHGLVRRGRKIQPVLAGGPEVYACAVWAAIRTGFRDGYTISATILAEEDFERTRAAIGAAAGCTRFRAAVGRLIGHDLEPALEAAAAIAACVRQTRAPARGSRSFDLELSLEGAAIPVNPGTVAFCLQWLKERGVAVQSVLLEASGELPEVAATARQFGSGVSNRLSLDALPDRSGSLATAIEQAAARLFE